MTVQAATLSVNNGTTPTSGSTVVSGGQNITFATIQLDASQSGENVRISSIPMTLATQDTSSPGYLSSCQIWNGSTALNTGSRVVNGSTLTVATSQTVNFNFDNALTVPKGTVLNLPVTCNLSSSAPNTETYSFAPTTSITPTGVTSGSTVSVALIGGTAPTIKISTGATLVGSTDSSSPSYFVTAGGMTGVTLNVIKLHAASEPINLQKVGFKLYNNTTNPSDITQAYVYAGNNIYTTAGAAISSGTLLGTVTFTGGLATATSTLSTVAQLPADSDATLIVKADLATIGINKAGTEGDLVAVNYDSSRGTGANSGKTVDGTGAGATSNGVRTFASFPTVALGPSVGTNQNGSNAPQLGSWQMCVRR